MAQENKNEASAKNGTEPASSDAAAKRQRLVARVAGSVAAGVVMAPSKKATTAAAIAEIATDIAEEIVKRAGL